MEGRQAANIAHCLNGATSTARAFLEETTTTQRREHPVASCLKVMCADEDSIG